MYQGITVEDCGISVSLNADTHKPTNLSYFDDLTIPKNMTQKFNQEQAEQIGKKYLIDNVGDPGKVITAKLVIHHADDYWELRGVEKLPTPQDDTYLSWFFELNAPWESTIIYVDATDGCILGGTRCRCSAVTPLRNMMMLGGMETVTIEFKDQSIRTSVKDESGLKILTALKNLQWSQDKPKPQSTPIASLKLEGTQRNLLFDYYPDQHLLSLREKSFRGKQYKGALQWITTTDLENLINQMMIDLK